MGHWGIAMSNEEQSVLGNVSGAPEFRVAYELLRNQLEHYQQLGRDRIRGMREDVKSAAVALRTFAEDISSGSGDYELELRQEVQRLERRVGARLANGAGLPPTSVEGHH